MKTAIATVALVFMLGCSMTNEEIITEVNKCRKAGLESEAIYNTFTFKVTNIICVPCDVARADSLRKLAEAK